MNYHTPFNEVVLVGLPSGELAERLLLRLLPGRMVWRRKDETHVVAAPLRAEPGDLASLLHELEAWLAETGLSQLQFELDGRTYSLRGTASSRKHPVPARA
jgi:hypothetical protein